MSDNELSKELGPAAAVCLVLIVLYAAFGLMTVIVSAALFDAALRGVEMAQTRRTRALRTAIPDVRKRM